MEQPLQQIRATLEQQALQGLSDAAKQNLLRALKKVGSNLEI